MRKKTFRFLLILALFNIILFACAGGNKTQEKNNQSAGSRSDSDDSVVEQTMLIAAAASLEKVFEKELIPMFEKEHKGVSVDCTYDSSGKLQSQIEKGLEADIFFSAATTQMDNLIEQNLIAEKSVIPLLCNELVMIIPASSDKEWENFSDLTKADSIAIGDPASVPAGQYAEKALKILGDWNYVKGHASLGTNVTEVLNWVAAESAEAGLVYATDAASNNQVKVVANLPKGTLDEPIIYPVGIVETTKNKKLSEVFIKFLQTEEAWKAFEAAGFIINEQVK